MKHKNTKSILVVLTLAFLVVIACTECIFAAEHYNLGVALGLTGTGAPYSREAVEGVEMAVNEINAAGGFLGKYPIKLFIRDTHTRSDVAGQVVKDLIQKDGINCLIGTYSSAAALAVKPICMENRVLHIATVSNSETIVNTDFSPYTFSVVPNTYMIATGVVTGVTEIAGQRGWKRYATIASDYAWGRSNQKNQVALFKKHSPDLQLTGQYWPRLGQTRFNSFIVAIMAEKPDFLIGSVAGADNLLWLRDARDYRLFKEIAYPGGLISVSELIAQAKSIRRGLYARCRAPFFAHMDIPMMADFVKEYKAKYDRYPSDWAVLSYDGVYALKQGIEKAGSVDAEKVKKAMKGLTIDTTRGRLFFRKINNQLSCSAYFGQITDDPRYSFPIYKDLMEIKGPDAWRTEDEILSAREK
jgi:branched-chain amino acid transport system substrate-binding protein